MVEDEYHAFAMHPELIKEIDWYDGKKECEEIFAEMPNLRQCQAIYDNKEVLNQSLTVAGFAPIEDEIVWSSTEYNGNRAWEFSMDSGGRYWSYTNDSGNGVRPILALPC